MKKPERICVFGDSTTWGAWDFEKGGWVNRLWLHIGLREEDYVEIYNVGISGGTSDTMLARFEQEANIRNADAIIFQFGGNDTHLVGKNGPNKVPLEKFRKNIEEVLTKAKSITEHILCLSLKKVDDTKTQPVEWGDLYYVNREIEKYNQVMKDICIEKGILFLDNLELLSADDFEEGLHPNASGHEKIFVLVRDFLVAHGWI